MAVLSVNFAQTSDKLDSILEPEPVNPRTPLTRLVATLGPNSSSVEQLSGLLQAGMQIARFDFSYGSTDMHLSMQQNLEQAMDDTGLQCAVMLDILGTEVVVINRDESVPVELKEGQEIVLTCSRDATFTGSVIPISSACPTEIGLAPESEIFVGQYLFTGSENTSAFLTAKEVSDKEVRCICNNSCRLEGRQLTVHVTDMIREGPVLHDIDIERLQAFVERSVLHVDYLNISFCRSADDIHVAREHLDKLGLPTTRLIAKIEHRDGLMAFQEIIDAADGIIFSRGNLGIDLPPEKMFIAQKMVLSACNFSGKPVIVARVVHFKVFTIVDTMIEAPRPTRAEATDVANLVLDGADGILLGAETWMGRHPALTAATVLNIARQAEKVFDHAGHYNAMMGVLGGLSPDPHMSQVEALASSAVRAAGKLHAALIIVFTSTGRTARIIAKYRPPVPVLAVVVPRPAAGQTSRWAVSGEARSRQCLLYRGILPLIANAPTAADAVDATDRQLEFALQHARREGLVEVGDQVVVNQCPSGSDSGSVKVVQVEERRPVDTMRLSSMRLGSTADFSRHLVGGDGAPTSPMAV